jgi:hypothetical protein
MEPAGPAPSYTRPVPAHLTYPGSRAVWIETRWRALVRANERAYAPFRVALTVARAQLAVCVVETAWGRDEYGFNAGNFEPTASAVQPAGTVGWHGAVHVLGTHSGFAKWFRDYASVEDFAADMVRVLRSARYNPALRGLVATRNPEGWYDSLLRAGYTGWSRELLGEFDRALQRLEQQGR